MGRSLLSIINAVPCVSTYDMKRVAIRRNPCHNDVPVDSSKFCNGCQLTYVVIDVSLVLMDDAVVVVVVVNEDDAVVVVVDVAIDVDVDVAGDKDVSSITPVALIQSSTFCVTRSTTTATVYILEVIL